MFDAAAPNAPDLALRLPADAYRHLIQTLRLTLPPPATESAEDLLRRDYAAIARIAALAPATAAEADLAAQFVAASEYWKDCLRLAQDPETTRQWAHKCRAQAASMMRQANSALRLLLRLQQARGKRDANADAADAAPGAGRGWTEHCAIALMAEALESLAAEPAAAMSAPEAAPPATELPPPAAQTGAAPAPDSPSRAAREGDGITADLIAAAERYGVPEKSGGLFGVPRYAALYPERAASIRRTGRLPHDVRYFCPPEAALARALIAAHTPALAALDGLPTEDATRPA